MTTAAQVVLTAIAFFAVMRFIYTRSQRLGTEWLLGDWWLLATWLAFAIAFGAGLYWIWQ